MHNRTEVADLSTGESTCLFRSGLGVAPNQTYNVVGAVPQPAKQAQHEPIGRMVAAEPSAPVQVTAAERCFSVGLPLILPCDDQKLLDSGSGDALGRGCKRLSAVERRRDPMESRSSSGSALLSDPHRCRSYDRLRFGPISCSSFGEIPCNVALAMVLLFSEIRNVAGAAGA